MYVSVYVGIYYIHVFGKYVFGYMIMWDCVLNLYVYNHEISY